jgi:hypothetical protein
MVTSIPRSGVELNEKAQKRAEARTRSEELAKQMEVR